MIDGKLIYVAGPFSANTPWEVYCNCRAAERGAAYLWEHDIHCVCPHLNSEHMSGIIDDATFYRGGMMMLERCDAVLVVSWLDSKGTISEIFHALRLGKPVFFDQWHAMVWADKTDSSDEGLLMISTEEEFESLCFDIGLPYPNSIDIYEKLMNDIGEEPLPKIENG